ncbi:hypothetical protein SISNIDRAFT_488183 [Sistotremastrum niveocremeum HHB9708]|uniref:DUF4218 domain-containing protein n=1 Tax=Sistotremastrum niveocremeum HHB9708 TaxID=1314777 RepID=A0A164RJD9_9AGAM|nr:hypothetical protein SISNIDRAFT_488183 [Sistotremastrum niveocremeum HHB9708]
MKFTVIDPMHTLFLNLVQNHFRFVLGMDPKYSSKKRTRKNPTSPPSNGSSHPVFSSSTLKNIDSLRKWLLQSPAEAEPKTISTCSLDALKFIAHELNLTALVKRQDRKAAFLDVLRPWHQIHPYVLPTPLMPAVVPPPGSNDAPPLEPSDANDASDPVEEEESGPPQVDEAVEVIPGRAPPKTPVLDKFELAEIWRDLKRVIKPSWVAALPSDLGQPRHGKLKSDQWRTAATIFLPVTLIRRWGKLGDSVEETRKKAMLDNTMHLINAIIIATADKTSRKHAERYTFHIQKYLEGYQTLYPGRLLLPSHHAALHLGEFLTQFGPVRAWWTFPFERLIGSLQNMHTNEKLGELEGTMTSTFIMSSNMRNILSNPRIPPVLQHCRRMFDTMINRSHRNTMLTEILNDVDNHSDGVSATLDLDTAKALLGDTVNNSRLPRVLTFRRVEKSTRVFTTSRANAGDSLVWVPGAGRGSPASICEIFTQVDDAAQETYVSFKRYLPAHASQTQKYAYEEYPIFGAEVWSSELSSSLEVLPLRKIISHCACTPLDDGSSVFVPLFR